MLRTCGSVSCTVHTAEKPGTPARPQASFRPDPAEPPPEPLLAVTQSALRSKLAPVPYRDLLEFAVPQLPNSRSGKLQRTIYQSASMPPDRSQFVMPGETNEVSAGDASGKPRCIRTRRNSFCFHFVIPRPRRSRIRIGNYQLGLFGAVQDFSGSTFWPDTGRDPPLLFCSFRQQTPGSGTLHWICTHRTGS